MVPQTVFNGLQRRELVIATPYYIVLRAHSCTAMRLQLPPYQAGRPRLLTGWRSHALTAASTCVPERPLLCSRPLPRSADGCLLLPTWSQVDQPRRQPPECCVRELLIITRSVWILRVDLRVDTQSFLTHVGCAPRLSTAGGSQLSS